MLDERETLVGLAAVDHEPHADAAEEARLPSRGPSTSPQW
jgi:hypothetical protein